MKNLLFKVLPIIRFSILSIFVLFLSHNLLLAHSGRTDSKGGHFNRKTGEYHWHHGTFAHQHYNGVCSLQDSSYDSSKNGSNNFAPILLTLSIVLAVWFIAGKQRFR
tara:strand:- start:686 stop:1006 length:321 start_codon:yes stop_codon:yes gene_type:complete